MKRLWNGANCNYYESKLIFYELAAAGDIETDSVSPNHISVIFDDLIVVDP